MVLMHGTESSKARANGEKMAKKRDRSPFFDCLQNVMTFRSSMSGAGDESRTRDLNLGKVALYQLSYSRIANLEARLGIEPGYTALQAAA